MIEPPPLDLFKFQMCLVCRHIDGAKRMVTRQNAATLDFLPTHNAQRGIVWRLCSDGPDAPELLSYFIDQMGAPLHKQCLRFALLVLLTKTKIDAFLD